MSENTKIDRCGFFAFLMLLILGTLFGVIGVAVAHIVMTFYAQYYLMLVMPLVLAILLGFGLSKGVSIGRCTRLNLVGTVVVLFFSIVCYAGVLFLNDYYAQQGPPPATIVDEALWLVEDGQNFLHELPYVGNYVPAASPGTEAQPPVEAVNAAPSATDDEAAENEAPPDATPAAPATRPHLGAALIDFGQRLPELAQQPLVIGHIFDLALLTPVRGYLLYDGVTEWRAATGENGERIREHGQLIFNPALAKAWMLWVLELLLVFLVALMNTRGGTKKARQNLVKKLRKAGLSVDPEESRKSEKTKPKKPKKKKKVKTSVIEDVDISADLGAPAVPESVESEDGDSQGKTKKKKKKKKKEKKPKAAKEKKGLFGFGRKKQQAEEPDEAEAAGEGGAAMDVSEDATLYALVLHQYNPGREHDLVQLIQQVGQMSADKARRLLKVPSLLKRDVSAQDAKFAIEKFNQVQAQVKLITMEQLLQIQQKQQGAQAAPPPPPQPKASPPPIQQPPAGASGEQYALILKRIDANRQQETLELLASLSGKSVAQLQQTLKPPALVLRDATRDEVMMIAQQFQSLQATVQSVTMTQLKQLIAKKKK